MKRSTILSLILVAALLAVATLGRLASNGIHLWNFAPFGAMGLFCGAVVKNKRNAFLLPLAALLLSDICLQLFTSIKGFYGWGQAFNYGAVMVIVIVGMNLHRINVKRVVAGSLAASAIFFIISNFGVWLFGGGTAPYTYDPSGLVNTYTLAVPFFGNTILGDLFYCGVLFGGYSLVQHFLLRKKPTAA